MFVPPLDRITATTLFFEYAEMLQFKWRWRSLSCRVIESKYSTVSLHGESDIQRGRPLLDSLTSSVRSRLLVVATDLQKPTEIPSFVYHKVYIFIYNFIFIKLYLENKSSIATFIADREQTCLGEGWKLEVGITTAVERNGMMMLLALRSAQNSKLLTQLELHICIAGCCCRLLLHGNVESESLCF